MKMEIERTIIIPRVRRAGKRGTESQCIECAEWYNTHALSEEEARVCPYCGFDHINLLAEKGQELYRKQRNTSCIS